jgi:hypothetical protein
MLRRNVPTILGKMLLIFRVPVREEVGLYIYIYIYIYIYLSMTESFGKSCCWNEFMIFWNVRTRLQDCEKLTYVDGVSRLSVIAICE